MLSRGCNMGGRGAGDRYRGWYGSDGDCDWRRNRRENDRDRRLGRGLNSGCRRRR